MNQSFIQMEVNLVVAKVEHKGTLFWYDFEELDIEQECLINQSLVPQHKTQSSLSL